MSGQREYVAGEGLAVYEEGSWNPGEGRYVLVTPESLRDREYWSGEPTEGVVQEEKVDGAGQMTSVDS